MAAVRNGSVALVMTDTRSPELFDWSKKGCRVEGVDYKHLGVATLTYYVNMKYANEHGYELLFYELQGEGCAHYKCGAGCFHDRWGPRHPSYCKVAGLGAALAAGYEWAVYVDSDAFMANATLPLPELLRAYGANDLATADAFFGWDHPYTLGPNMGFIALRNTPLVKDLVSTWWNLDAGQFAVEHPFEQRTLQWGIMHMPRFRKRLVTLNLRTMDPDVREAVVHLDHNAGTKTRLWTMAGATAEVLCVGDRGSSRAKSHCTRKVRSFLPQLRRPREEVKLGSGKRDRMLDTVLSAMCNDFKAARRMPFQSFNASHFGHTRLRQPAVTAHALRGAPLHLANCSDDPLQSPWQTWSVGTGSMLRLPWDSRINKPKPCTGFCLLTILSLDAQPELCLTLGGSRSPRAPYTTLAQLELCQPEGLSKKNRRAAQQRSRLNFNETTGILRTSHHLGEFRRLLPEHQLGCGFWSNCSGIRTVLPKPCWGGLSKDPAACGDSEPTINIALKRYKNEKLWPGYKRFVVAPDGPASAAVLATPGKDRLCMQTWRGFFKEGQSITFVKCPQKGAVGKHKWKSTTLFEWQMLSMLDKSVAQGQPVERRVRIVPKAAPHLCLSAPALVAYGAQGSEFGGDRPRPAALRLDYATRMHKLELKRNRRDKQKAKALGASGLTQKAAERQRRQEENKAKKQSDFKTRRRQVEAKRLRKENTGEDSDKDSDLAFFQNHYQAKRKATGPI